MTGEKETKLKNKSDISQYVTFDLNNQRFGIDIHCVVEVLTMHKITHVVHTPKFIKGVINLRGQILTLIDLNVFFGFKPTAIEKNTKIIVISYEKTIAGFIVDKITQIKSTDNISLDSVPAASVGKIESYIHGIAVINEKPLVVLDLAKIFNSEEFKMFE